MKGKSLTLIGTAMTLMLTSNVAMAESSKSLLTESSDSSMGSAAEIKMSPEGMKILCKHFPLNSRCPNGIPLHNNFLSPAQAPESSPVESDTNLDTTTVPITPTTVSPENSTQLTPAPLVPTTVSPENSTQLTPVPESSSLQESGNSGNSSEQVPVNILPATPPSGM
ncbi:hypothetical protein [Anabaena sp. UHCC 0451]|uniref:hypothetical protein n=1 Tax=Anabaena sp. UHCC 0451 TaxID=2055235 RepID=UPI002B20326F|nr:hypothetical protein [Anabaena sp. UHCC 0451]MEA5579097.1 hypothetical protein [Anabaena sp. UHCC 0451]